MVRTAHSKCLLRFWREITSGSSARQICSFHSPAAIRDSGPCGSMAGRQFWTRDGLCHSRPRLWLFAFRLPDFPLRRPRSPREPLCSVAPVASFAVKLRNIRSRSPAQPSPAGTISPVAGDGSPRLMGENLSAVRDGTLFEQQPESGLRIQQRRPHQMI